MEIPYSQEAETLYCNLNSFKILKPKSMFPIIKYNVTETYSKLPLSQEQEAFMKYCVRSLDKGAPIGINLIDYKNILTQNCVYCGDKATSIDRIDNSIGYTKDNVQPTCKMCNIMKYTFTEKDFLNKVRLIASRYMTKNN